MIIDHTCDTGNDDDDDNDIDDGYDDDDGDDDDDGERKTPFLGTALMVDRA